MPDSSSPANKAFFALITPISPAATPPSGGTGIWGPTDPRPTPPIVIVKPPDGPPVFIWGGGNEPFPTPPIHIIKPPDPEDPPLVIWGPTDPRPGYGPVAPQPHPEHPIVIPPPPDPFPDAPPEVIKPSPDEGGWGYANPPGAWYFVPPQDAASPK